MPRLAGMIHTISRRRPLMGAGGSSLPEAVPTKVLVVIGVGSAAGSPSGTEVSDVIVEGVPLTIHRGRWENHTSLGFQKASAVRFMVEAWHDEVPTRKAWRS